MSDNVLSLSTPKLIQAAMEGLRAKYALQRLEVCVNEHGVRWSTMKNFRYGNQYESFEDSVASVNVDPMEQDRLDEWKLVKGA
jgi:hypothetical protein